MAKIKNKVQNALNESRMLILGTQVLIGFQVRVVLQTNFDELPRATQISKLVSLIILIITLALLIAPGAFHRIVKGGEDGEDLISFTARMLEVGLLLVAASLGIEFFAVTEKLFGFSVGVLFAFGLVIISLFFWYGLGLIGRAQHDAPEMKEAHAMEKQKGDAEDRAQIADKIEHVLTEARIALPGAQALLGFLFASMFIEGFDKLPVSSKYVHFVSLVLVTCSTILLITPAAYHRIAERGEETEHFQRIAGRILLIALVPLALGICSSFYVVAQKILDSTTLAVITASILLLTCYGLWFAYTFYRRKDSTSADA